MKKKFVTTPYSSGFTLQLKVTEGGEIVRILRNHPLLIGIHSPTRCIATFSKVAMLGNHPLLIGIHSPTKILREIRQILDDGNHPLLIGIHSPTHPVDFGQPRPG